MDAGGRGQFSSPGRREGGQFPILRGQDRVSRPIWASSRPQFSQPPLPSPNKYSGSSWVLSSCWDQLAVPTTSRGEWERELAAPLARSHCTSVGRRWGPWLILGYFYTADLRSQMTWAQILTPPSTICETLYKFLSLSASVSSSVKWRWSRSSLTGRGDSISESV